MLFLPKKDLNRHPGEVEVLAHLVLYKTPVRLLDVLREVAIKRKCGGVCRQLLNVLDLDVLPLKRWRWRMLDDG